MRRILPLLPVLALVGCLTDGGSSTPSRADRMIRIEADTVTFGVDSAKEGCMDLSAVPGAGYIKEQTAKVGALYLDTAHIRGGDLYSMGLDSATLHYYRNGDISELKNDVSIVKGEFSFWIAVLYANSASKADGLDTVYTFDGYPKAARISADTTKNGYRLPTISESFAIAEQKRISGGVNHEGGVRFISGDSECMKNMFLLDPHNDAGSATTEDVFLVRPVR